MRMNNEQEKTCTITRKITLRPQGDKEEVNRVYKYIENGMEVQSLMMNQCISAMYSMRIRKVDNDTWKETMKLYGRIPTSKLGSAYSYDSSKYPVGLPIAGSIPRACNQKFRKACQDGLLYGKVSLPTFRKTAPMFVHNDYINIRRSKITPGGRIKDTGIYHDYETPGEFIEALYKEKDPLIHIKFANGITFDVVFGNPYKSHELRSVFERIFSGEYKICDSSIGLSKSSGGSSGRKIILNLSLTIPRQENILDENTVVGVDLGLAVPAVCALNNDPYHREYIGSYDDFTRKRMQMQAQKRSITKHLKNSKGGHGRRNKLKHLDQLDLHERNFAKTYNHMVSRRVVEFALRYHAKYINMENLSGIPNDDRKQFVLRNWSYYELQEMIKYKALREGIIVRFVDPSYTSQTCSICGKIGNRYKQSEFICSDPVCKIHTMYKGVVNADFNGARNIAMSEKILNGEKAV